MEDTQDQNKELIVVCFDIGIRNLAYCCYDVTKKTILGWKNYDLLNDSDVCEQKEKSVCLVCSKNALYIHGEHTYCGKHCPCPIFKDLSGNVYKKMPVLSVLKEMLKTKGTKEQLYGLVRERYSLLIQKKTATKKTHDLEALHDSIRKFVIDSEPLFRKAHVIGLENQPVLKNPTMKTVQILLYATLRDVLQPPPKMKLIHALKKVADKESGDKGYADRKKASIERVNTYFKTHNQPLMKELLDKAVKKADLCDALCMCLDYKI